MEDEGGCGGGSFFYDEERDAKFRAHVMFHKTPTVLIVHYFDVITTKRGFEKL